MTAARSATAGRGHRPSTTSGDLAGTVLRRLLERRDSDCAMDRVEPGAADAVRSRLDSLLRSLAGRAVVVDPVVSAGRTAICHLRWADGVAAARPARTIVFHLRDGHIERCWWAGDERAFITQPAVESLAPDDPVLDAEDIQGHVLAGFDAAYQELLFLTIDGVAGTRRWLAQVRTDVSSLRAAREFNAERRGRRPSPGPVLLSLAFTFQGLAKLTEDAAEMHDLPFKEGLDRRSALLGDPRRASMPGHVSNWVVGGSHNRPDVLVLMAAARRDNLATAVSSLLQRATPHLRLVHRQHAATLTGLHGAREHFGFREPISQPSLRGVLGDGTRLTSRRHAVDLACDADGRALLWPGEFVFGQRLQSAVDRVTPGPIADGGPRWTANGSLLVVRRLRQDVAAFRRFAERVAAELADDQPHLGGVSPGWVAAKLVGRWPSGTPLVRAADADAATAPGGDNDFDYVASGDLRGLACPQGAHVRKAYPRDHPTSAISQASVETHRLLRRGIPFGPPYPRPGERGLLFLAYQTSLERQFEFVTRAWLNNPSLHDDGDGHDPIAGQNASSPQRARRFLLPVARPDGAVAEAWFSTDEEWVVPTGGGYFFSPSVSALGHLAG